MSNNNILVQDQSNKTNQNQDYITSLELLNQINFFRNQIEGKKETRHDTLLNIIRDEFEDEINARKLLGVEYQDKKGESRPMFNLTISQAKQVLVRESKAVRKAVIQKLETLEAPKPTQNPITIIEFALAELKAKEEIIRLQAPKVDLADTYLVNGANMNLSTASKVLNIQVTKLNKFLSDNHLIFESRGNKVPYVTYQDWFYCKPFVAQNGHSGHQLLVTPLGLERLSKMLKPKNLMQKVGKAMQVMIG